MRLARRLKSTAANFGRNENGQFGILFAIVSSVLMLSTGLAIDYTRIISAKSQLTNALDVAVTSTTRDITRGKIEKEEATKIVRAFLEANLDGKRLSPANVRLTDVSLDPVTSELTASAEVDIDMMFPVLNRPKVQQVAVKIGALYSERKVEVSMVLDVTGSMLENNKIGDLKIAAKSAVKSFLENGSDNTRVAITPYSWGVNSGPLKDYVQDVNGGTPSDSCATERRGPHMFSDASPEADKVTRADRFNYYDVASGNTWQIPKSNWSCPTVAVQPLTRDADALNSMIDRLQARGATAGQIGIQWGWYMISPNWKSALPADSEPEKYRARDSEKYIILMTDGMFNSEASGLSNAAIPNHPGVSLASGRLALSYCAAIKDKDIKVYTIGFDLKNAGTPTQQTEVVRMLTDCASRPVGKEKTFYNAQNGTELKKAFDDIARRIQSLRLTN
jgi:Flp pilus assembly protein TadG